MDSSASCRRRELVNLADQHLDDAALVAATPHGYRRNALPRLVAPQCHPLAVSVNRDERSAASRPRTLSLQNLSSQLRAHRTLGSRTMVTPKRTSHPSGSRPARLAARGPWLRLQPQKTLCSPPRPFLAAGLASRTALWLHRSVIQHLVAHGTVATNS